MIFFVSTKTVTIGTDAYLASNIVANDVKFAEMCNVFSSYNEKYSLDLLPQDKLPEFVDKLKKVVYDYIYHPQGIRFNNFDLAFNGISIMEVQDSKIYDINCKNAILSTPEDRGDLTNVISYHINRTAQNKNISVENIHELVFDIELLIFEKGHPIAIVEPGELSENNHEDCWRYRVKLNENEYGEDYNDEDDGWEDF